MTFNFMMSEAVDDFITCTCICICKYTHTMIEQREPTSLANYKGHNTRSLQFDLMNHEITKIIPGAN